MLTHYTAAPFCVAARKQVQNKHRQNEEEPSLAAIGEGTALEDEQVEPLARALYVVKRCATALPQVLEDVPSILSVCDSITPLAESAVKRSGFIPVFATKGD